MDVDIGLRIRPGSNPDTWLRGDTRGCYGGIHQELVAMRGIKVSDDPPSGWPQLPGGSPKPAPRAF
jgi:hypothetical protein